MDDRSVQDMDGGSIDEDIQDSDTPAEHTRHPKALLKRVQGALAARFKRADAMTMAQDAGSGDRTGKRWADGHSIGCSMAWTDCVASSLTADY